MHSRAPLTSAAVVKPTAFTSLNTSAAFSSILTRATGSSSFPISGSSACWYLGRVRCRLRRPVVERRLRPCAPCADSSCVPLVLLLCGGFGEWSKSCSKTCGSSYSSALHYEPPSRSPYRVCESTLLYDVPACTYPRAPPPRASSRATGRRAPPSAAALHMPQGQGSPQCSGRYSWLS